MFLSTTRVGFAQRCLLICMILVMLLTALLPVHTALAAQQTQPLSPAPSAIKWEICKVDGICFGSKKAREDHAKQYNCRFLEDVCEAGGVDNQGAPPGDQGFWGGLWDGIKSTLVHGYNFVRGFFEGMKGQIGDLIDLISNPKEVISGLVELGKAFYNDPKGTIEKIGELLGQEAVDAITKASQCGSYNLGKVVGSYASPAVMLKLASRLTKYAGKLSDAVRSIKADLGCASFAPGTLVMTPNGPEPIERISVGQLVDSRNETSFAEKAREVEQVFSRIAPTHRLLHTDLGMLRVTDEHPLWVQGKGWTEAHAIVEDDVIAGQRSDVLVIDNKKVNRPLRVHNFSVARTPSYFVGPDWVWAHNAKCALPKPYRATPSQSNYKLGASDGGPGVWFAVPRGNSKPSAYNYEKQVTGAPRNVEYRVGKVNFDGFDSKSGTLIDAKNFTELNGLLKENDPERVELFQKIAVLDARRQLKAAGTTPIEYHVSNQRAVKALTELFKKEEINIKVIFTPDIVN